ncbi:MAG: hypothetical protein U1F87_07110 [Kiritimatiellia bacterium]
MPPSPSWSTGNRPTGRTSIDGDTVQAGDPTWTVYRIILPMPVGERRGSPMRAPTSLLLTAVVVGQLVFLVWISSRWNRSPRPVPPTAAAPA